MERREFLQLLGVGALGSLSGCASVVDQVQDQGRQFIDPYLGDEGTTSESSQPSKNRIQVLQSQLKEVRTQQPMELPTLHFDYEPAEFTDIPDRNFDRIVAEPAEDVEGDYLQIEPNEIRASELANRLRIVWGVENTEQTTTSIASTTVSFKGGKVGNYANLVGFVRADEAAVYTDRVLASRASSLENAIEIAKDIDIQ